jgi:protein-glutamine gamma-glutamyltransferase
MNKFPVVPCVLVTLYFGKVSSSPWLALMLAMAMLSTALLRKGIRLSRELDGVVTIGIAVGGFFFAQLLLEDQGGGTQKTLTAVEAGLVCSALSLTVIRLARQDSGRRVALTLALALCALAICGRAPQGGLYVLCVAVFLITSGIALRLADPDRPPQHQFTRQHWQGLASVVAITLALSVPSAWLIPIVHHRVLEKLGKLYHPRVGFSDRLALGSMNGLLQSDRVVMRLRTADYSVDYLRGIVYRRYQQGRWLTSRNDRLKRATTTERPTSMEHHVTVEFSQMQTQYYFVPSEAHELGVPSGSVLIGNTGIVWPRPGYPAQTMWFTMDKAHPITRVGPEKIDTELDPFVAPHLKRIAQSWVKEAHATDSASKLQAIYLRLRNHYQYSLYVNKPVYRDPLLYFLNVGKKGHCEYFASAMAALARSLNIPARVVAGYRVQEYNILAGYHVVRERDAHAWVEAWVPDQGWVRYDPTPISEEYLSKNKSSYFSSISDWIQWKFLHAKLWFLERTLTELLVPIVIFVCLWVSWKLILILRQTKLTKKRTLSELTAPTPPSFEALLQALASHHIEHRTWHTLDQLKTDIQASNLPESLQGKLLTVLATYAHWRYGGVGTEEHLAKELEALTRDLQSIPVRH